MVSLIGKKLLILGGSKISCEIVNKAKQLGIHTAVTDWYPVEKSPAKQIADEHFMTSTADIEAMVNLIKENNVDGVVTGFTDSVLPYYAEMCEKAGLPHYGTKEQFELMTNKVRYKKLCREFGIPIIEDYNITVDDLGSNKINQLKYPVLVKPADGSGAKGVSVCKNPTQLIEGYKHALAISKSKEILVERYVNGKEVTVFYTLQQGEVYFSGMGNRHMKNHKDDLIPLPVAYTFPSTYITDYRRNIEPNVKRMFRSAGMKNGMVFMQCLIENNECLLYDIGYRLTGTLEYKLMEEIQNHNTLEMMIHFALTGKMNETNLNQIIDPVWNKYACNISLLIRPGKIGQIVGVEAAKLIDGVKDIVLTRKEGDELSKNAEGTLSQITVRVFAISNTIEELKDIIRNVQNKFEIRSVENENLLIDGFDPEEIEVDLLS